MFIVMKCCFLLGYIFGSAIALYTFGIRFWCYLTTSTRDSPLVSGKFESCRKVVQVDVVFFFFNQQSRCGYDITDVCRCILILLSCMR